MTAGTADGFNRTVTGDVITGGCPCIPAMAHFTICNAKLRPMENMIFITVMAGYTILRNGRSYTFKGRSS
jgi:hypothetical protein